MKIFIVINAGGDGSYYPSFIRDQQVINLLQTAYDDGHMDYENGVGVDGDGFHYKTITVPDGEVTGVDWLELDDLKDYDWYQDYLDAP